MPRTLGRARAAAEHCASLFLPDALGKAALRRAFARSLVSMRGLPLKMSQALSMSADPALADVHRKALADLPPMPAEAVRSILLAEAPDLAARIEEMDAKGIPASLGQVNRVRLRDGRICALKIRYPGISPQMDLDRGLMDLMLSAFAQFRNGFDIGEYRVLIAAELRAELDYPSEARRQSALRGVFPAGGSIIVPRPYPEDAGEGLLLMDWEPSVPAGEYAESLAAGGGAEAGVREAELIAEFHLGCLFSAGVAHADPNPGNFGYRAGKSGPELVVYDYGSVVALPPEIRLGLPALVRTLKEGGTDCLPALAGMGFQPAPLEAIRGRLGALCSILFEPFLADGVYDLKGWKRGERVRSLLGAERWNFMVAAPPSLFPLMRAFHGLFHYAGILGGRGRFGAVMERRLRDVPAGSGGTPPAAAPAGGRGNIPDTRLRIRVRKGRETTVSLTLPGDSAGRLESLIDPDLLGRIRARGQDPGAASRKAVAEGFRPGPLCEWTDGETSAEVWLE